VRRILLDLLDIFWTNAFAGTWRRLAPQLETSRAEKERLFAGCSLQEFFERALIRATVDAEGSVVVAAVRGGYRLALDRVTEVHFFPSAFNDRRYWSALGERSPPLVAFFPYFDPTLTLDDAATPAAAELARPDLDAALILKALGDSTRFAIAMLLADKALTSVELARALAVSKPTVSHHVSLMRQAGLLRETHESGAVRLALDPDALRNLSSLLLAKLYGPPDRTDKKTAAMSSRAVSLPRSRRPRR
jgi:DNA-binding transcriptional ArsR family regulator